MSKYMNQQAVNLQISGIRQFFNRVSAYPQAVQLTLGQPDFPTPDHVKEAAVRAIEQNETRYTPNAGTLELRSEASRFVFERYGLEYDAEDEIITTVGASQALDVALRSILNPLDEVIIPAPVYPAYEPIIRMCGAVPVLIDTSGNDFVLSPELVEQKMTDATKAVILPYPSNPTGVVLTDDQQSALARFLTDKPIFVVADEIYSELNYGQTHQSIASHPGMREKTIVINGLSKSHSMTGWRLGFLFAPRELAGHILKVHQYNVSCASSITQSAGVEALKNGREDPVVMKTEYKKRRDFVLKRLEEIGIPAVRPDGAFYVFPDISKAEMTSYDFAVKLLEEEELAVVPGDAFSSYGEGFIRLSYAYHMDELVEAMNRLERFWQALDT
ncbi:aminotransferase A [Salisediminibacterium halotolerans]